ncbi:hypothetical protein BSZ35_19165 [Salinibacter sp. 10B]|uniref:hypothetical protein n=1 Tax=Salinibacter sp. 10B TaxID=1923971 RepID=UPI000CF3A1BD|nr:hypothetical protein [Salinibacter sp. 10B]PQJ26770.1 hypothetical protein BSZ35_19165 [Salinibacter sp. 10B]
MTITLHVRRDGTTYTYQENAILARSAKLRSELRDGVVDVSDVELVLGVDSFVGESVPGAILSLPAGRRFRAQIEMDVTIGGTSYSLALEGSVATDDIDRDDKRGTLRVIFRNLAPEAFWKSLERVNVTDLEDDPSTREIPGVTGRHVKAVTYELQDDQGNETPKGQLSKIETDQLVYMARVRDVFSEVLTEAGITHSIPAEEWAPEYPTFDGSTETQSPFLSDLFMCHSKGNRLQPLPNWTGRYFIERVLDLTGWRVDVSYEAFPSEQVTATFKQPTFSSGQVESPPWDKDAFGVATVRDGRADFALLFGENGIGEEGTDILSAYENLSSGEPIDPIVPPTLAVYAPRRWAIPRTTKEAGYNTYERPETDLDGSPTNADLVQVQGFKLPELVDLTKYFVSFTEDTRWYGKLWYQTTPPYYRKENDDPVYLCQLDEENAETPLETTEYPVIYARRPPTGLVDDVTVSSDTSSGSTSVPISTGSNDRFRARAGDTVVFNGTNYLVASDIYLDLNENGTLELQSGLNSSLSSGDTIEDYYRTAKDKPHLEAYAEHWARSGYRTRPVDRDRSRLAEGRILEPLQPSLIENTSSYDILGAEWATRKAVLDLTDASTEVELRRPAGDSPLVPAVEPTDISQVDETEYANPQFVRGDLRNFSYLDSSNDQWYILVHWRPPVGSENKAFQYRVQIFEFDVDPGDGAKTVQDVTKFGCNHVYFLGTSPTSDDGSVSGFDGSGDFQAEVTTVLPDGREAGTSVSPDFTS